MLCFLNAVLPCPDIYPTTDGKGGVRQSYTVPSNGILFLRFEVPAISKLKGPPKCPRIHSASVIQNGDFLNAATQLVLKLDFSFPVHHFNVRSTSIEGVVYQRGNRVCWVLVATFPHRLHSEVGGNDPVVCSHRHASLVVPKVLRPGTCQNAKKPAMDEPSWSTFNPTHPPSLQMRLRRC